MNERYPKRLRRAESFLGIHFDFHADESSKSIGKNVTREMVERIIKSAKPDYIQCDCKGHPGFSSYPTRVGYRAPGFVRDQLKIWREVTAKHGVALYMHYCGIYEQEALKHHPSWACVDENGKRHKSILSVFGPYVEKVLIPQLEELSDDYGVDGFWIDGDCWIVQPDYGAKAVRQFQHKTGIKCIPRKPGEPYFPEFLSFHRQAYRNYLKHYVDEVHRHNPHLQICANWSYSSKMPEPVTIDVDFLSGDSPWQDSVNSSRMDARCLAQQGKPWDLMSWSFRLMLLDGKSKGSVTKSVPQLQQEAAVVISHGGGFQPYFNQKNDGSICEWHIELMTEVAKFCRARQKICFRAKAVPQVGLIYSGTAMYRESAHLFSPRHLNSLKGVLQILLESQNAVEILMEHHLIDRMHEYPLLILPEWGYLEPAFRKRLVEYVRRGGKLLVIGPRAARIFKKELGVVFSGKEERKTVWLEHEGWLAGLHTEFQKVRLKKGIQAQGKIYSENDNKGPWQTAASIAKVGKGQVAGVYLNLGESYYERATSVSRRFLNSLVRELFPKPMVEVKGSQYVDVVVNRIDGKLAVNLINTSGPHADSSVLTFDEILPVGPLSVAIHTGKKPKRVTLEPQSRKVAYTYRDGVIKLRLDRVEIHDVVVVEYCD